MGRRHPSALSPCKPSPSSSPSTAAPSAATPRKGPDYGHTDAPYPAHPPLPGTVTLPVDSTEQATTVGECLQVSRIRISLWGWIRKGRQASGCRNLRHHSCGSACCQDQPLQGEPHCTDLGAGSRLGLQILHRKVPWDPPSHSTENIQ